ncbi:hypothetical protein MMC13_003585 [Lambiella insularis]|nr:hypothetical protein [Lambiella insularis]
MIAHQLFSYHKCDHTSKEKLDSLMCDIHKHVDPAGWHAELNNKLATKVIGKINRTRKTMLDVKELYKVEGEYVWDKGARSGLATSLDLDEFCAAVEGLPDGRWEEAFCNLVNAVSKKRVHLAYADWIKKSIGY